MDNQCEYKIIEEYPNYAVTVKGEVFNVLTHHKLIPYVNTGYEYVSLRKDGNTKKMRVHRLVANAFLPNPENLPVVNHKDENKLNNKLGNLEWCTHRYNAMYGTHAPSNNIKIAQELLKKRVSQISIKGEMVANYKSITEASQKTGISRSLISHCCCGDCKTAGGYIWQYA